MLGVVSFAAVVAGEGEMSIVEGAVALIAITAKEANICGRNNYVGEVPLLIGSVQWEIIMVMEADATQMM